MPECQDFRDDEHATAPPVGTTSEPEPEPDPGVAAEPGPTARVELDAAARSAAVRRATIRLCLELGWSPLHETRLPNGRRADVLALRQDGGFACIEVKSGPRDFLTDDKWHEYRPYCDALWFAVDAEFPLTLLPADAGLIVAHHGLAEIVRNAPEHRMTGGRRRGMLHRFAQLASLRVVALEDPQTIRESRAALLVE